MKKTAVIICPGRGTYNAAELGYLKRHHSDQSDLLDQFDARRTALRQAPLQELDQAAQFSAKRHTRGDNASALIYAAAYCDAQKLHESYDVVGVTGNSMGWYIALAVGAAMTPLQGFEVVNTMGTLMQESLIGGQCLYPFVDEAWQAVPGLRDKLLKRVAEINARPGHDLAVSIHLGGMLVVGGNEAGLSAFEKGLPPLQARYPMRLSNHAAFHTSLQNPVAEQGQKMLPDSLFAGPQLPLIDGCGQMWYPDACKSEDLRAYTLGAQVTTPYDFTLAVQVAAKTLAPDVFIVMGPGTTLGGAVAQSLIQMRWRGLSTKVQFQERQESDPVILSMGRPEDRAAVLTGRD